MNEFEKACNTENYTGETSQENVIEWIRNDKEVTVTLCGNSRYATKVRKLAEQYPDEVKIMHVNNDNSIVAHLPLSYIKISHPKKVSEKQIEVAKENMRKLLKRNNL
jgi:hypothetical protein